jgi:uncharacterized phage-associated protein
MNLRKYNSFNIEKIIQVLAYIQKRIDCRDKLKLIKLLFFADRYHLRKYVSFISFDIYYALQNGPAASKTLNVINHYNELGSYSDDDLKLLKKIKIINNNDRMIKESNTDYMSKVEMDVIEHICDIFGKFDLSTLIEITHDYPEWKRYKNLFSNGACSSGELIIIDDFFENPDIKASPALLKYFDGKDPLYVERNTLLDVKEFYMENELIKNAYN